MAKNLIKMTRKSKLDPQGNYTVSYTGVAKVSDESITIEYQEDINTHCKINCVEGRVEVSRTGEVKTQLILDKFGDSMVRSETPFGSMELELKFYDIRREPNYLMIEYGLIQEGSIIDRVAIIWNIQSLS